MAKMPHLTPKSMEATSYGSNGVDGSIAIITIPPVQTKNPPRALQVVETLSRGLVSHLSSSFNMLFLSLSQEAH